MINLVQFKHDYIKYLEQNLKLNKLGDHTELTLPFYDRFNDSLQLYIEREDDLDAYVISDDSYIINSLKDTGLSLSKKRLESIDLICRRLGVKVEGSNLIIKSNKKDLVNKAHILAQAMLRVDDMYLTAQHRVAEYFVEDVKSYFDMNDIFYSENINITGKSGFSFNFDFLLQRNKNNKERLCRTINNLNKDRVTNILFAWGDIDDERPDSDLIVIINDKNPVSSEILSGLHNYGVKYVKWSEKSEYFNYFI